MINDELKNLVNQVGAIVLVENDQPKFIVLPYDKFRLVIHKDIDNSENFDKNNSEEIIDRLNKEILALKAEVTEKERELSNL